MHQRVNVNEQLLPKQSTSLLLHLPALLCLAKGFSVALALDVQLAVVEPKELEERDFPRLSELTFLVLLVAVLLQSAKNDY